MSLSSTTAQTRELTELRNHLKWLDEERRKSSKKMAELEQRLAKQGRELSDRDQKIQELEWHINNFSERFERLPDLDTNVAGTEQRLQDLEWHLANMNSQLTRVPNMEEERARLIDELTRAVATSQERAEASQIQLESRLRMEMASLRESDEQRILLVRLNEQAQAINEMDQQFAALQESVGILSAQLRERTSTLAAESQANFSTLASGLQEHLDTIRAENEARTGFLVSGLQEQLEGIRAENEARTGSLVSGLQEQLEGVRAENESRTGSLVSGLQAQLEAIRAEWQGKIDEVAATRSVEPSPQLLSLTEELAEITENQQQWQLRFLEFERSTAEIGRQAGLAEQQNLDLYRQLDQVGSRFEVLEARQAELDENLGRLGQVGDIVPLLDQLKQELEVHQAEEVRMAADYAEWREGFEARTAELAHQLALAEQNSALLEGRQAEQRSALLEELNTRFEQKNLELQQQLEQVGIRFDDLAVRIGSLNDRHSELDENLTKLGHVREIMPLLDRLEQELELRQAEEVRLSNLIGTQESRFSPLASSLDELKEMTGALISRVSASEQTIEELRVTSQDFNDNFKPALSEFNRRVASVTERLSTLNNSLMKAESGIQTIAGDQAELREMSVNLRDDMRRNQSDISRQIESWQATLDENKDTIERFTQQWVTLSNQYKEARMAVQNFAHWQKQLEAQKREASEMLRVESNRMQSRWDGFLMEIQEKLKNFELDLSQKWQAFELENEQKWSAARRNEQLRHEELAAVDELIQKLQQDNRNLIWRVQAAQADAIKKWPRLLMEEVEKAVEINPNRRLSTTTPPRADMSVVDAIEQGLITIDYNDDPGIDL